MGKVFVLRTFWLRSRTGLRGQEEKKSHSSPSSHVHTSVFARLTYWLCNRKAGWGMLNHCVVDCCFSQFVFDAGTDSSACLVRLLSGSCIQPCVGIRVPVFFAFSCSRLPLWAAAFLTPRGRPSAVPGIETQRPRYLSCGLRGRFFQCRR